MDISGETISVSAVLSTSGGSSNATDGTGGDAELVSLFSKSGAPDFQGTFTGDGGAGDTAGMDADLYLNGFVYTP